jgi:hypothetical protein
VPGPYPSHSLEVLEQTSFQAVGRIGPRKIPACEQSGPPSVREQCVREVDLPSPTQPKARLPGLMAKLARYFLQVVCLCRHGCHWARVFAPAAVRYG